MSISVKRLFAGAIDHIICCFIGTIIGELTLLLTHSKKITITVYFVVYAVALCFRDVVFSNASIGKYLFNIKIIAKNGEKILLKIHLKRAIPMLIFPLEIILIVFFGKRIGDMWTQTTVKQDRGRFSEGRQGDGSPV